MLLMQLCLCLIYSFKVLDATGALYLTSCACVMQSSYGFIHYFDRRSAALAILSLNGRHL